MNKKFISIALAALAFALATPTSLSAQQADQRIRPELAKMSKADRLKALKETKKQFPLVSQELTKSTKTSPFAAALDAGTRFAFHKNAQAKRAPGFASASTTIWGNVAYDSDWTSSYKPYGYYSFQPVNGFTTTLLTPEAQTLPIGKNGAAYSDGHIHGIYADLSYAAYGIVSAYLYDLDVETGALTSEDVTDYSLIATETAQASDGTVYGQFYDSSFGSLQIGVIDYEAKTRTTIGTSTTRFIAMGVTKAGELYGIGSDGNLYKISTVDASETLIGSTGVSVATSSGGFYGQTGEIDQADDTFYWMSIDGNANTVLYTVNLETAALTKVSDCALQVYGMLIPSAAAADGAPAKVADAKATFEGESLSGNITFTAPSLTYGGGTLSGTLNYTIYDGKTSIATGTVEAGAAITVPVTVTEGGSHTFNVTTSNAAGESPMARVTVWVGIDQPSVAQNIVLSVSTTGAAALTWDAPTTGVHGGFIGDLTYDVYRASTTDTVKVASDITLTAFTEDLPTAQMGYYTYIVYAKNKAYTSAGATSNGQLVGEAIYPDWTEDFLTEASLSFFTIIDNNNDGKTWRYSSGTATSNYNSSLDNDDWLITPPIHMTTDRTYLLSYSVKNGSTYFPNTLEVLMGNDNTVAAMTKTLQTTFTPGGDYVQYDLEVAPTTEGNYYFGFHDNSPADQLRIVIDWVSVKANALTTSPDSVINLKVTPAEQGALSATVSFNAPWMTIGGSTLSAVDSIVVSRDGVAVKTFGAAQCGDALSFVDKVPASATYEYAVVAYKGADFGRKATASAFIGVDVPEAPATVNLADNQTNVLATWPAYGNVGENGGYIDPAKVSVSLYEVVSSLFGYYVGDLVAQSTPGATSTTVSVDPEASVSGDGTQSLLQYFTNAANDEGESSSYGASGALVVGPTIGLPFEESFTGGSIDNSFAWLENSTNNSANCPSWSLGTDISSTGDGGCAVWESYTYYGTYYEITEGDQSAICMPKVSVKDAANAQLIFSYYSTAGEKAKLQVRVAKPDGTETTEATIDLSQKSTTGWATAQVDLNAFKSERYILVKFYGISEGDDTYMAVDDINIIDQYDNNLRATNLSTPTKATAGQHATATVSLRNMGKNAAKDFSVVLYANNIAVDTVTVSTEVASMATTSVVLDLPVKINDKSPLPVYGKIVYAADQYSADDATATNDVKVVQPNVLTVNDLQATGDGSNVSLSWTEPVPPTATNVTETFEDYDDFATEFGDWTTYFYAPNAIVGGFSNYYYWQLEGEKFAYTVFNPHYAYAEFDMVDSNPGFEAHGGDKYAASIYKYDIDTYNYMDADNWLISPALSGNAQTIKFYAMNLANYPESFDVMTSTTDNQPASFTKVGETYIADGTTAMDTGANWKEVEVALPAGTNYFAIRNITAGDYSFCFGIDDVTYEAGYVSPGDIVGYKIYRDGEYVATVDGTTHSYTDAPEAGNHIYNVTILYKDANGNIIESSFSNNASIATSIEAIENAENASSYDVYTADGKAVMLGAKTLKGLKKGLYIINDKKYILK